MYVEGMGTLSYRRWSATNFGVDFDTFRDSVFLDSYQDRQPVIYAPEHVWAKAYCADKLAMSGAGVASVPTFTLNGREYVNTGSSGTRDYHECHAWTIRPLAQWDGPTYSYQTHCQAWDEGRIERGDQHGLVVSVRGKKCVLDGPAVVYDDQVGRAREAA